MWTNPTNSMMGGDQFESLRFEAHSFARDYIRPGALEADQTGNIPERILNHRWSSILSAAYVPVEYGGGIDVPGAGKRMDCSSQLSIALAEELAWGDPGIACGLPGPSLTFPVLLAFGSEEQKIKYLSLFSNRKNVWGAFAITEGEAGTDAMAIRTRAQEADGGYVLNGTKCFITNGARADYAIVFATVDPALKQFGHRAFIVDNDAEGFSVGTIEKMMGLKAAGIAEIVLRDCFVPETQLLRGPDRKAYIAGIKGAMVAWSFFRTEVSAMCVGIARAVYEELSETHGIEIPSLKRDVDIGRNLCRRAAFLHDAGQPDAYAVSLAKACCARLAMRACVAGIESVGAPAIEEGHLFERLYRAAKVFDILEGTGEIHREHICTNMQLS